MMRSLFAMLSLLVCTATASAECAWVLWQKVGVRDQANTAMGSASPCQAAIADRLQRAEELGTRSSHMSRRTACTRIRKTGTSVGAASPTPSTRADRRGSPDARTPDANA